MQCGGGGDCFYHCCLFWIRKSSLQREKEIVRDISTHQDLRTATVNHLNKNHGKIKTLTGTLTHLLPSVRSGENLVKTYCAKHGKKGEYVEDPCVHAFADLMDISIKVYHTSVSEPQPYNYDAAEARPIMSLWCDGGHYMVRHRPLTQNPNLKPKP